MADLAGRVVFITGGGSGIGLAVARRVIEEGGSAAVFDRDPSAAAEIGLVIEGDVGDEARLSAGIADAIAEYGRLDGLVTCAGIFVSPDAALLADVALETFELVLHVNLVGTFLAMKHALPRLCEHGGAVVTIASTAALRGHGFGSGYTASKGGVDALTRLVAVQYGPRGVRANCICPGGVDTPMTGGAFSLEDMQERVRATHPLQKVARPEEIASVAAFLLGDDASHLTGQTIAVEGGATIA